MQSKINPVTRVDPERTRLGQLKSNVTLKPDGVIVHEMKKYKAQKQKLVIQITRNKNIVSPRLRKDIIQILREMFYPYNILP